jgi:hypothetical protein
MADKLPQVTGFQSTDDVALMNRILGKIDRGKVGFRYMDAAPTASQISLNEIVVYDDGAGTLGVCILTDKGNIINLT